MVDTVLAVKGDLPFIIIVSVSVVGVLLLLLNIVLVLCFVRRRCAVISGSGTVSLTGHDGRGSSTTDGKSGQWRGCVATCLQGGFGCFLKPRIRFDHLGMLFLITKEKQQL